MINNKLFNSANEICRIIQNAGFNAYFVGGCIRDMFMNIEPHDIDITTNALPASIQKLFSNHIDTGLKHGTVSVKLNKEDSFFEVTTFRIDGEYKDGRHPENVVFVNTVEDDLSRRDFTINAIAYDPVSMLFIDPFNGKTDINNKIIRTVGNAKDRFMEDPLRILRALRFAIKFGFIIEENTARAMHDIEVLNKLTNCISKERVTNELHKILTCNKPIHDMFIEFSDVIDTIFPNMVDMHAPHNSPWHKHNLYEHTLCVVDACNTTDFEIKLAALFHDIGKSASRIHDVEHNCDHFYGHPKKSVELCEVSFDKDLRLSNIEKKNVLTLIGIHDIHINCEDKDIRRMIVNYGEDIVRKWMILKAADFSDHIVPEDQKEKNNKTMVRFKIFLDNFDRIVSEMNAFSIRDLAINGNDLITIFNLNAGPKIGEILNIIFNAVIEKKINNTKDEIIVFIHKENIA